MTNDGDSGTARDQNSALLAELHDPQTTTARREQCRDALVELNLPLVEHCVRRFRNRGEAYDDLVQVGSIGLLNAIERYDADLGFEFTSFATPTILGEIRRHFRDKAWAIRVPRRLQELRLSIAAATSELSQTLARSPTPSEIAQHLGVDLEDVLEGLESSHAYATVSLDAQDRYDGDASLGDIIGFADPDLEQIELRESLRPLLEVLPPREKKILLLRFFRGMTQAQIAQEIGVSQMHVSRLLNRTLRQLRNSLSS